MKSCWVVSLYLSWLYKMEFIYDMQKYIHDYPFKHRSHGTSPVNQLRESSDSDYSRTERRSPVKAARPPVKDKRDQASGSTDYTDTSYTITESDISFETDTQQRRSRGKQGEGIIEKTIEELSEEG